MFTTKLDKFLNDPASKTQPVRRHRLEDIHFSYTANGEVQGVHVEIWDETARQYPDGRFAEAVERHDVIVRPADLADLIDLLPDHADLLAQISAREAALVLARDESASAAERANAADITASELSATAKAQAERLGEFDLEVKGLKTERTELHRKLHRSEIRLGRALAKLEEVGITEADGAEPEAAPDGVSDEPDHLGS